MQNDPSDPFALLAAPSAVPARYGTIGRAERLFELFCWQAEWNQCVGEPFALNPPVARSGRTQGLRLRRRARAWCSGPRCRDPGEMPKCSTDTCIRACWRGSVSSGSRHYRRSSPTRGSARRQLLRVIAPCGWRPALLHDSPQSRIDDGLRAGRDRRCLCGQPRLGTGGSAGSDTISRARTVDLGMTISIRPRRRSVSLARRMTSASLVFIFQAVVCVTPRRRPRSIEAMPCLDCVR